MEIIGSSILPEAKAEDPKVGLDATQPLSLSSLKLALRLGQRNFGQDAAERNESQ